MTDVIGRACDQPLFIVISQGGPPGSLAVSTTSLPTGTVGTAYSQALTASGGSPPYTSWSVVGGALPPGLSVCSSGTICGTPTTTGTSTFAVEVTDNAGTKASQQLSIAINHVSGLDPGILSTSLPSGTVGAPYSHDVQLFGTLPPFTVSVVSGSVAARLVRQRPNRLVHRPDLGHANHRRHVQLCPRPHRHHRKSGRPPTAVDHDQSGRRPADGEDFLAGRWRDLQGGPVGADGVQLRRGGVRARDRVLRGLQRREWRDGVVDHVGGWSFHLHGDRRPAAMVRPVRRVSPTPWPARRRRRFPRRPVAGPTGWASRCRRRSVAQRGVRARDRVLRGLQRREWRDGVVDHVGGWSFHLHGDRDQQRWSDRFGEYVSLYTVAGPVSLTFSGSISRSITGTISAGSLHIRTAANGTPLSVHGRLTVAATDGSRATVQVAIMKVSGRYIGEVAVRDPGDGISTVAAVLTTRLSVSNGLVTSTATGLSHRRLYRLAFTL